MIINTRKVKRDFPIFRHNKGLVYLDNAATTFSPISVDRSIKEYYRKYKANVHRGVYAMSAIASEMYDRAHRIVSEYINAQEDEIVLNSGATMGLNTLAFGLGRKLKRRDNIVLTRMEHHANLIPWQQVAKQTGCGIRFIELTGDLQVDLQSAKKVIDKNTKVVSVVHVSNSLGTVTPVKEIVSLAQSVDATTIIDGSQSIAHMKIDVKALDCDFFVFSGHKISGPTGIGVLYGRKDKLQDLEPFVYGGEMVSRVTYDYAEWTELPHRLEPGTPNIAGAIGLATAIQYLSKLGRQNIFEHDQLLVEYAQKKLNEIEGLEVIGPKDNRVAIFSFNIKGIHHYDLGVLLDKKNIAVRTGYHCTQPLLDALGYDGTVRASFYFYNSNDDVDRLVEALQEVIEILN